MPTFTLNKISNWSSLFSQLHIFNNKIKEFQKQYTDIKFCKQIVGAKQLFLQNFNVTSFKLFCKNLIYRMTINH